MLASLVASASLLACAAPRSAETVSVPAAAATRMGVHGMVLFGDGPTFVSHLPMFHAPHDVQLVAEVRLAAPEALPASFSGELYTIEPERFSLDELRDGRRTRFAATVYRGNFEQGGQPVARDVTVHVVRIVVDAALDGARPTAAIPDYLALGRADAATLVHVLGGAPGFDHVVTARWESNAPSPDALARGVRLSVPGMSNLPEARLAAGRQADVVVEGRPSTLTVTRELSCLVGPDFTAACP
jgi:hypothetical protein